MKKKHQAVINEFTHGDQIVTDGTQLIYRILKNKVYSVILS